MATARPNDNRPIQMRSTKTGLSIRLKPGDQERIGDTGRFETREGRWAHFSGGQCILQARTYLSIWPTRDAAVAALKGRRTHGVDFFVVDVADDAPPTTSGAAGGTQANQAKVAGGASQ